MSTQNKGYVVTADLMGTDKRDKKVRSDEFKNEIFLDYSDD